MHWVRWITCLKSNINATQIRRICFWVTAQCCYKNVETRWPDTKDATTQIKVRYPVHRRVIPRQLQQVLLKWRHTPPPRILPPSLQPAHPDLKGDQRAQWAKNLREGRISAHSSGTGRESPLAQRRHLGELLLPQVWSRLPCLFCLLSLLWKVKDTARHGVSPHSRKVLGPIPDRGKTFLCGICMFSLCLCGFSAVAPVSPSVKTCTVSTLDQGTGLECGVGPRAPLCSSGMC